MKLHNLEPIIKLSFKGDEVAIGPGIIQVLEGVQKHENLSRVYEEMELSPSKGWRIIKLAQEAYGAALLHSQAGGKHGGTTVLTEEGKWLVHVFRKMEKELYELAKENWEKERKKK